MAMIVPAIAAVKRESLPPPQIQVSKLAVLLAVSSMVAGGIVAVVTENPWPAVIGMLVGFYLLFAIKVSAVPSMMRACLSRSACAWRDMVSSNSAGIFTSRISTDWMVIPQPFVFSSRMRWSSRPIDSRSVII